MDLKIQPLMQDLIQKPDADSAYRVPAPHGGVIEVNRTVNPDDYPGLNQPDELRAYYIRNGYVVVRSLVPGALCDRSRQAFREEIKGYDGYLYRQASAKPEKHVITPQGLMLNSLLNLQDLPRSLFPIFWEASMRVICATSLQEAVMVLLGEPGRVVQSMYFEGNPVTWAHQDTYYLDSGPLGHMTAAWIALEDIHPGAGRFYVYPGSHHIDMARNGGDFDIAFNHARYKNLVLEVIRHHGLECKAPAMKKGDVLFWSSRTMHGSLETTEPEHTRSSITAHFIPRSSQFLQYQTRVRKLRLKEIGGVEVHCPKDQNLLHNRLILKLESGAPRLFPWIKQRAIKYITR